MEFKELCKQVNEIIDLTYNYNIDDESSIYDDIIEDNFPDILLSYGATRLVFAGENCPYIIKTPNFIQTYYNYCKKELHDYEIARDLNIAEIFLPLDVINGYDNELYKQKRLLIPHQDINYNDFPPLESNYYKNHKDTSPYITSPQILRLILNIYGEDFTNRFIEWQKICKSYDFHRNNYTLIDNKLVIFDYAGYDEKYEVLCNEYSTSYNSD